MNRRRNWFDKMLDRVEPVLKALYYGVFVILAVGFIRALFYACGSDLSPHWYDVPMRWLARVFIG